MKSNAWTWLGLLLLLAVLAACKTIMGSFSFDPVSKSTFNGPIKIAIKVYKGDDPIDEWHGTVYGAKASNINYGTLTETGWTVPNGDIRQFEVLITPDKSFQRSPGEVGVECGGTQGGGGHFWGSAVYYFVAGAVTFSPSAGTLTAGQTITLSSKTPEAVIYYTLDGSTPSKTSAKYTGPITLTESGTLTALATAGGYKDSDPTSMAYTVKKALMTLTFDPPSQSVLNAPTALTVTDGKQAITTQWHITVNGGSVTDMHGTAGGPTWAGSGVLSTQATLTPVKGSQSSLGQVLVEVSAQVNDEGSSTHRRAFYAVALCAHCVKRLRTKPFSRHGLMEFEWRRWGGENL